MPDAIAFCWRTQLAPGPLHKTRLTVEPGAALLDHVIVVVWPVVTGESWLGVRRDP